MIVIILFLVLTVPQLGLFGSSDHCHSAYKKVKAMDMVYSINKIPEITWKARAYELKEVDLNLVARTKLGVKMEDMHRMTAAEIRKLEKESKKSSTDYRDLPENFTWADTNRTTCPIGHIRDQSNCGGCWAVAPASVLSDRFCLRSNGTITIPLSHEKLLTCITSNDGCQGGYMDNVFEFLKQYGTITGGEYESDQGCQQYTVRPCGIYNSFPCAYSEAITPKCKDDKCNNDWYEHKIEKNTYKMLKHKWIPAFFSDEKTRQEIYDHGPILAFFWVYPDFMFYSKGIYIHKMGWYPLGGHAVKVVGWGIENGVKYWHVANSWGKYWGENGYFRIRRGTNECSFDFHLMALVADYNNTSLNTTLLTTDK